MSVCVYTQFVLHYRCARTNTRLIRVTSRRLRAVNTLAELITGVDIKACALVSVCLCMYVCPLYAPLIVSVCKQT